ncbi:MAG: DUF1638 domain-containing protein [Lachnospiraceae bacterium]|nr:DUF1638 domain-containing protein [Lachnospiraceae bacterium]
MRLKLIGCKLLQREIASIIAKTDNIVDVTLIRQDYHQTPEILRKVLQEEIDAIESGNDRHTNDTTVNEVDAIAIVYGLCSNATLGIKSSKYKLVIPKAHDCSTLLMGSKEAYASFFEENGGSYVYSRGWLELGINEDEQKLERLRKEFMEKFEDEDTVEYLLSIEKDMLKNYDTAVFLNWPGFTPPEMEEEVKKIAADHEWKYKRVDGNNSLLKDLIEGNWDPDRFVCLEPGQELAATYDEQVIKVK